jgi:arginyl-tRNA synthetase
MTASSTPVSSIDFGRATLSQALYKALASITENAVPEAITPALLYAALERPPEAHLGDYALPCFRMAKDLKRKPPEIAAALAAALPEANPEWIEKVDTVGAFLNITLKPAALAKILVPQLRGDEYFSKLKAPDRPRVMIEYSQPNTHKAFHVGHMRNLALGDALGRVYEACGYPVVMANYIGDEGAHIAKCLWYIHKTKQQAPAERRGEWLGEMYSQATIALEDAPADQAPVLHAEVSKVLRAIESKQGPVYEEWKETRDWSLADFNEIYSWTGARFDHCFYESEVSEESQRIVDEYLKAGVFALSDGAIGLDLKEEKLGFVIVRKTDGNTTYATKDLALARVKFRQFQIKKSIYVVASEQNLHFKQVFRTLEKMGFSEAKDCFHLSYGMVVLPDGKMSSRKGNVIKFRELRERMEQELDKNLEKYRGEWSEDEILDIRRKLAVGAIRYGMICSDPAKDIVFDLPDWLSFEGNTGPYLMYTYARTRSIMRKAQEQSFAPDHGHLELLQGPEERELLRYLNDLNGVIQQTLEQNKLSLLCHHIYNTCKVYNRFLANVQVLKADSPEARGARLALLDALSQALKYSLQLLGIEPPERM